MDGGWLAGRLAGQPAGAAGILECAETSRPVCEEHVLVGKDPLLMKTRPSHHLLAPGGPSGCPTT
jgi:hypothetical protein